MGVETVLMIAGAAFSAYSAIQQVISKLNGRTTKPNRRKRCGSRGSAAVIQAEKIRKLARAQAGESTAALAGSGVDVGEGTAVNINQDIYRRAEEDAVMTIFGGIDRAKRGEAQAQDDRIRGEQAQTAGYLNAAGSVLSAASATNRARGYRTSQNASVPPAGGY